MKYSKEEIKNHITDAGYVILGKISTANDKILCLNKDGYMVLIHPGQFIRRGDVPDVFSKYNPYTIENINKFICDNNYSCKLLSKKFINAAAKLEFQCECGDKYFATLSALRNGKRYCNYCAKSKRYDGLRNYQDLIEKECLKRNYTLLSNQNLARTSSDFNYICNKHKDYGVQHSTVAEFMSYGKGGCSQCCIEKRSLSKRKDEEYFKALTEKAGMIYVGIQRELGKRAKILFKCPQHLNKGVQSNSITNMKNMHGKCVYCVGRGRIQEDLQQELDSMGADIDIVDYTSYSERMTVKCRNCGTVWQTLGVYLTQGHGCQSCVSSKFERSIKQYLEKNKISFIPQFKFNDCKDVFPLPFDFYLPDFNTLIEADGEGHYYPIPFNGSVEDAEKNYQILKRHDNIKNQYCANHKIRLIRIPYWEKNNIEDFINKTLYDT